MRNNLILTMKAEKELSAIRGEQTLFIQPTNHPLITHLSPTFGSHLDAIRKYAAMVILMLFIGVGQMWGATWSFSGTSYMYFHNKAGWTDSGKMLFIGKDSYSSVYTMSTVSNTQLWVVQLPSSGWSDASYMAVAGGGSVWDDGSWESSNRTNATHYTNTYTSGLSTSSTQYYVFIPNSTSNNASISLTYLGNAISNLNKTITVKAKVSKDGGSSYSEATSPGTLSASSKKFTTYNSCASATSLSSGTISCGYTATTTLTAADATGYDFVGWYNSSGTQQTTSKTLTIYPTANATYYAYYKEKQYSLTFSHNGHGSISVGGAAVSSGSTAKVNYFTTKTLVATANTGYHFAGWTISGSNTSAVTIGDESGTSTTIKATNTGATITAVFEEDASNYTLTFGAGSNGSVSAKNTSTAEALTSGSEYASGTGVTVTATPAAHYHLEGWYSDAGLTTPVGGAGTTNPYSFSLTSNTAVYAKFALNQCAITLDRNGGTAGDESVTATYGSTLSSFTAHTRSGYTLNGYFTETSGGTKIINADGTLVASTSYANSSKQWNSDASALELHAQWTENKRNVTISAGTGGSVNVTSVSVGVATSVTVTATAMPGYKFSSWTATNCSVTSATSASTTLKGDGNTGSGTLVANFIRTYAFIEGRFQIKNAARTTTTYTGTSGNTYWATDSRNIEFEYDGTNHRFFLHTYLKPAELAAQLSNNTQYFRIQTSTSEASITGGSLYTPASTSPDSNQKLSASGSANKKATSTTANRDASFWFTSSDNSGYTILYFDEAGVWYELEHTLNYDANTGTGSAPAEAYYNHGANATAAAANTFSRTGYTFNGWNTIANGSGTAYAAGASVPMNSNITLYAQWTPTTYTNVTLDKTTGSTDGKYSVTYNATNLTVTTAPAKTGYDIEGYYKTYSTGTWTTKVATPAGALQASTGYTDASNKWTSTTSPTLYTKWTAKTYAVTLDKKEGSTNGSATATYDAAALTSITAPTRTGYHVEGYYGETGLTNKVATDAGVLQSDVAGFTTGTAWTKDATATLYTKWTPNTYTIAFNANDANYVGTATGTTASIAATYDVSYTLTANGFSRTGYTFAGWNTNADGTSGTNYTNSQTGVSNLTATNGETVTLYAKWTGITYTVTFNARGGSGLTPTSKSVTMGSAYGALATVTPPAGYIFDGWYTASVGGTKVTGTTQVTTASDHTLYAHYVQKAQVYFKNTLGWDKVYVTYDAYWVTGKGAGNNGKTYHKMKLVAGTTDVYYDDIPDAVLSSWKWNIAFDNTGFCAAAQKENPTTGTSQEFFGGEAVFRYDFDSKATMFVPTSNTNANEDGNFNDVNSTQYRSTGYSGEDANPKYTSGYWRTYNDTYSGYTMTYEKNGTNSWSSGHKMESNNVGGNSFIYTVTMDANSQYNFAFYKEREVNTRSVQFRYGSEINSSACTDLKLVCDPNNAWMKTTVAGDYTFILTMGNDGHLYLTVDYPFGTNDYKVVYSYTKDGAKTYESEIIKGRADGIDTISVFIHSSSDASSRSLKIARCTDVNASGVATWNNSYATIDISSITKSGVYNFIITQDGSATATGAYWNKYTGNYYIRTDVADGGWDLYKYREDNKMTLSEYSLTQTLSAPYSHYYCRFVESTAIDITYAVATDYSPNISGILVGDATIGGVGNKTLPVSANVRFTYNENTNGLFRAYLKSAQGSGNTRYLVLHGKAADNIFNADTDGTAIAADGGQSLAANELLFTDIGNWIYQINLKAKPKGAVSLIAEFNGNDRYLIGGESSWMEIMGGSGDGKYEILAVYDFKTNRLMTVWTPSGEIKETLTDVDVLLIRHAQDPGVSITFGSGGSLTTKKVYGALEFQYDELVGRVANWTSSSRPLLKFFVSFPFDVNVSDIFGLNSAYGDAYVIEEYDGAERAEKGFFRGDGTTTFWKEMKAGDVMKANVGYCVIMDNDYLNNDIGHVWDNKSAGSKVYLYFPSAGDVGSITSIPKTIKIPEHKCEIDRTFNSSSAEREVNHKNTDSNWNMMGVPVFDNHSDDGTTGQPGAVFASSYGADDAFNYFYEWNPDNNQYAVSTAKNYTFKSMHGYMVQYHGDVTFKTAATPASVAARRAPNMKEYQIELQVLDNNEDVLNRTYVELRENADDEFILNEDVYLSPNNLAVEIFTFAGNYDVAANVLPIGNKIVPVGVEVRKAGTYTFSMPSNFSGTVELVDTFNGERTNLAMGDYSVYLEKGYSDGRFVLEINVNEVPTAIDGVVGDGTLKDGKAHKFIQNGVMYILQNGVQYDAQGKRVK